MRRISIVSVLILIGCSGVAPQGGRGGNLANPCSQETIYARGIACIDPANTNDAKPYAMHSNRGGHVDFWFSKGNDNLTVDSDVLENIGHDGPHAWGDVKKDAVVGQRYKYTAHRGAAKADPEIIIDY